MKVQMSVTFEYDSDADGGVLCTSPKVELKDHTSDSSDIPKLLEASVQEFFDSLWTKHTDWDKFYDQFLEQISE